MADAIRQRPTSAGSIGILMLETSFERFVGDIGNARTWPFPVQYRIVKGASPDRVTGPADAALLAAFKAGAGDLVAAGVDGITTTCGFLALWQHELAAHVPVPVATSALLQVPMVARMLPKGRRPAIFTFSAEALSDRHLIAVGVDPATPKFGMAPASAFQRAIRTGDRSASFATLRAEVLATAERAVRADPSIGALVLECTNLTPYSAELRQSLAMPIFDMVSLVHWFHRSLRPEAFAQD